MTSEPSMIHNAGSYSFSFAKENIHVTLDRIREKQGRVTANITVILAAHGLGEPIVSHINFNLTSVGGRKAIVTRLNEPDPWEHYFWERIIDTVCTMTLTKLHEGAPVITVGSLEEAERARYRLG
ncbi:MAG: hypothetical protein HOC20_11510 [Chloroflexi bacterium]|jgi:hypothetical protein|nr:hypothetical protein [Chloroflexota bacterium]